MSYRNLERSITSLDGKSYGAYKSLKGSYDLDFFTLSIDRVQSDPYAPPSLMRVIVDRETAGIPADLLADAPGRLAVSDFLMREFYAVTHNSDISIGKPAQAVLERTNIKITDNQIEARITVQLPAGGRRIHGYAAARTLTEELPDAVEDALLYENLDAEALVAHVRLLRDQEAVRAELAERNLVAFVGNGAILPRQSGDSDLPLTDNPTPFVSPESLEVSFELPSGDTITGMGVPEGIVVIIGGGYHGKSTLLRAIELGVYPHIAGDGREWVISRTDATSIRAEDGRPVTGVDISPFINNLPSGADTQFFHTTNASGSTSQAANLMEALEAGASALLIDEDTSATNFMIRDDRMQQLIPAKDEPITPFVQRIRPLFAERGVSTILVAGGSGAFFDVADHVIAMNSYVPSDVTAAAHALAEVADDQASTSIFTAQPERRPLRQQPERKPAKGAGTSEIRYGRQNIDLGAISQLIDAAQTSGLAHAFGHIVEAADGQSDLTELVDDVCRDVNTHGVDALSPHNGHPGLFARPRRQEIFAAVNRYRRLEVD
ncbi:MAG: ABC-ATPase domain-containing protein [Corynebacterium sp.]|nr:ABC-ATPase domain-containing protein [Corynebacterium sp.]